ncbi:purine-nucleoside phosphorylase [Pseudodesulfovibrio piezophilus]|uniref:Purine nucleoside phosphorylase n=1 Tax=Pseudodesulfovibrio piezophilus (strain DSM 21447 / JCM 15486 / C1TLV30) TaxID=1322246 RepID=M1WLA0_PSEP2|nr:purine-nucleoside phosphorylase [Pseudodesulfovibrio piezophilus]CCH47500.1 Purine nucleoside phosphorylase 1 [Pseudodesulfovibrio piezophilus C1TLV30]
MKYIKKIQHSAAYIQENLGKIQDGTVALMTGTGLGKLTDAIENPTSLSYDVIPEFPVSTVKSHAGQLIQGTISSIPILALHGRFHLYEGLDARQVVHGIRTLGELGIKKLILTNAAGALNPSFLTGSPMLVEDHINLTGTTPLRGKNEDNWGKRFPDMCLVYDKQFRKIAKDKALELGIHIEHGVFMQIMGPNMETPAETRMYRNLGADAIGMSTCMEAIAAHHMGIRVLAISCLTNKNLPDCMKAAPLEQVISQAEQSSGAMTKLICAILKEIHEITE